VETARVRARPCAVQPGDAVSRRMSFLEQRAMKKLLAVVFSCLPVFGQAVYSGLGLNSGPAAYIASSSNGCGTKFLRLHGNRRHPVGDSPKLRRSDKQQRHCFRHFIRRAFEQRWLDVQFRQPKSSHPDYGLDQSSRNTQYQFHRRDGWIWCIHSDEHEQHAGADG
jgi:hypothetical protein